MSNYVDLKNIVDLHRSFINNTGASSTELNTLDTNLQALSTKLSDNTNSVLPTLTYQSEVKTILENEQARLDARKGNIDAAYAGQKRMVDLTNSATKRGKAYNMILIIFVVSLLIVLGIKQLYDNGIIPNAVLDIFNIIVLSGGVIYCVILYVDISKRSNMDFDRIDLGDPTQKTQAELEADRLNKLSAGSLSDATAIANAGCIGAQCCPVGSTFNEYNHICVPDLPPLGSAVGSSPFIQPDKSLLWKNAVNKRAVGSVPANTSGCDATLPYDPLTLACKVAAAQGFTTLSAEPSTSSGAKPYTPCEFNNYNSYNSCGSNMM
jgi:hypothetical protein